MAKIKYSALVSEMRNKLNGSVMSKNRYGNYVRNKVTPVNPQTSFQQNQRAILSNVSQAWSSLSIGQRNGFATLAENHPFTDIFGDRKVLDGKAMFSKLNINLLKVGLSTLQDAPTFVEVPYMALTGATANAAASIELDLSLASVPSGYQLVVDATPALPATINFVKNRYRQLGVATVTGSVADITGQYQTRFGALVEGDEGKVIHFRVSLVNETTGQVSIASEINAIVVNTP